MIFEITNQQSLMSILFCKQQFWQQSTGAGGVEILCLRGAVHCFVKCLRFYPILLLGIQWSQMSDPVWHMWLTLHGLMMAQHEAERVTAAVAFQLCEEFGQGRKNI